MSKNELIVISGATKGIGLAIAQKFASEGFKLAICARSTVDLEEIQKSLFKNHQTQCFIFQADLSIKSEVLAFAKFCLNLKVPFRCLVNNAGVFLPGQLLTEPDNTLETMINTNLYSAYHLTRALVPKLTKSATSHIFNICSIASITAYAGSGSYSISKFAMLGFSKSIREELKKTNVKVTAILPGPTLTDSWAGSNVPNDRFMTPKDISDIIWSTFCLSPQAVVEEIVLRPLQGDI